MVEIFGMQVNLELIPKNIREVEARIKEKLKGINIFGGGDKTPAGGAGGGIFGGMEKQITLLAGIAGGIMIIVSASKMLQRMLGSVVKVLMLILRPIGDMLAVALMPILYILKPVGLFFNTLMRPYIQKAMTAIRAGALYTKAGNIGGAMGMFGIGAQYLLQPFLDMFAQIFAWIPGVTTARDAYQDFLDDALVRGTLDAVFMATDSFQELGGNIQSAIDILQKLNLSENIRKNLDNLEASIKDPLKKISDWSSDEWTLYGNVKSVLESLSKFVSGEGGEGWQFNTKMMEYLAKTEALVDATIEHLDTTLEEAENIKSTLSQLAVDVFRQWQPGWKGQPGVYQGTVMDIGRDEMTKRLEDKLEEIARNTGRQPVFIIEDGQIREYETAGRHG